MPRKSRSGQEDRCENPKLEYMVSDGEFSPGLQIGKSRQWLEEVVDAWLYRAVVPQREWMRSGPEGPQQGARIACARARDT